jgi:hypothetical protein
MIWHMDTTSTLEGQGGVQFYEHMAAVYDF